MVANVPKVRGPIEAKPRLFGPTRATSWARAAALSRSCRRLPSSPVSANPPAKTTAAPAPWAAARSKASVAAWAGTQMR